MLKALGKEFWQANPVSKKSPVLIRRGLTLTLQVKLQILIRILIFSRNKANAWTDLPSFPFARLCSSLKIPGIRSQLKMRTELVILGVGLGGLATIEVFHSKLVEAGPSRVSPFYIPMLISNIAPGQIAIAVGAKGPNYVLTSACASATHSIGSAYTEIVMGRCDAMITGGAESTITPMGISGFTSMKALCTKYNDSPEKASRPFDAERGGFVMGEGAGMLLLESLDSALDRGAHIYAEVVGFGASDDANHMVAPLETGEGMALAMKRALQDAQVDPNEIDSINAHGTSTHANDEAETKAIKQVFGDHAKNIAICSNKSQLGHLLGAAGGVESVLSVLTLDTGMVPGTINLENPDPVCDLNYMPDGPKKLDPKYVLCSNFGFGGTNASMLYKRYEA